MGSMTDADMAQMREKLIDKAGRELSLDDSQQAKLGSPPDLARAQALTQRLPISIRIDGPQLQWSSHPQRAEHPPTEAGLRRMLVRDTADGHHIRFGLGDWRWPDQPRWHGWGFLAGLGLLTALAYAYLRRLFRPLDDIRAAALRTGGAQCAGQ